MKTIIALLSLMISATVFAGAPQMPVLRKTFSPGPFAPATNKMSKDCRVYDERIEIDLGDENNETVTPIKLMDSAQNLILQAREGKLIQSTAPQDAPLTSWTGNLFVPGQQAIEVTLREAGESNVVNDSAAAATLVKYLDSVCGF